MAYQGTVMTDLFTFSNLVALMTLTFIEIVLGVDNILMVSINVAKLPAVDQPRARSIGMGGAMIMRIFLICSLSSVIRLVYPIAEIFDHTISWRDLILLGGGAFLVYKASHEVYVETEGTENHSGVEKPATASFARIIAEIMALDIVFSLDSVITAIGMAQSLGVMISAVILSMCFMMKFAGPIGDFIHEHTSIKVLALAFLLLIGVFLIIEGMGQHVSKGYIYAAMGFAFIVELLHMRRRSKTAQRAAATRVAHSSQAV